jgi:hypothetical protein
MTGGKQAHRRLITVYRSFSRLLRHPWKKEMGDILLFYPGHHTRPHVIIPL